VYFQLIAVSLYLLSVHDIHVSMFCLGLSKNSRLCNLRFEAYVSTMGICCSSASVSYRDGSLVCSSVLILNHCSSAFSVLCSLITLSFMINVMIGHLSQLFWNSSAKFTEHKHISEKPSGICKSAPLYRNNLASSGSARFVILIFLAVSLIGSVTCSGITISLFVVWFTSGGSAYPYRYTYH